MTGRCRSAGITLVVVLVLLVVISLTAAAAMRSAITQEKVVNNLRAEFSAQTQAELALRYCEGELLKLPAQRTPALQGVEQLPLQSLNGLQWKQASAWQAPAGAAGTAPDAAFLTLASAQAAGPTLPQCLVERLGVAGGRAEATVVTARGFSPDYRPGAADGSGASGSVVWLQSFLYFE